MDVDHAATRLHRARSEDAWILELLVDSEDSKDVMEDSEVVVSDSEALEDTDSECMDSEDVMEDSEASEVLESVPVDSESSGSIQKVVVEDRRVQKGIEDLVDLKDVDSLALEASLDSADSEGVIMVASLDSPEPLDQKTFHQGSQKDHTEPRVPEDVMDVEAEDVEV